MAEWFAAGNDGLSLFVCDESLFGDGGCGAVAHWDAGNLAHSSEFDCGGISIVASKSMGSIDWCGVSLRGSVFMFSIYTSPDPWLCSCGWGDVFAVAKTSSTVAGGLYYWLWLGFCVECDLFVCSIESL